MQSQIATQRLQSSSQHNTLQSVESEEQLEKLRRDLAQAQQDVIALRLSASTSASMTKVQSHEGSTPISEQIAEQVEAIRAELTARHDERMQQEELLYKKRTDNMRALFNTKLKEGKESARNDMMTEHAQALENLKARHKEEMDVLETRHRNELDELKRNEKSAHEQPKQDTTGRSSLATNGEEVIKSESQVAAAGDLSDLTESQVKHLIATNDTVRSIVKRNIVNALTKEKESVRAQVKEEQQKVLADALTDADTKANDTKEQAVLMEGKKYVAKLSMVENRAKIAQVKLDCVEKASNETPQKPVIEVWQIAKTVKPTPATSRQPQQTPVRSQGSPQNSIFGKPASSDATQTSVAQGMFGKPTPSGVQSRRPSTEVNLGSVGSPAQANLPSMQVPTESSENNDKRIENQNPFGNNQQSSRLPDKPLQNQGAQRPNVGTSVSALKNLQSGLPIPNGRGGSNQTNPFAHHGSAQFQGSQQNRGGTNHRGRGRGYNRAGSLNVSAQGSEGAQQAQSSPTSGAPLSATARQFVPGGNKRLREDGQDGGADVGNGKRIRGGAQGN